MKPRNRCETCSQWSSTDKVWGDCMYASSRDDGTKLAQATHVELGNQKQATLETKWDFGCRVWRR